ncbi:MAG TPA: HAMP domain-containing sensor histidine kinase, partial [Candidatus Gastranaerophilaceae bacterium]|nr:HAMP domain-containing sensor histidine kinase [Candidatus Gastranaerophilaceae bacterium]
EKDVELKYTLADVKICADIKRFRQLIYNLVSNAIKFNKKNGKVNVLTYTKDDFFFFEVSDTGDGISKNDYAKIFDFFSQVNRSQLKRQLGSGIGLALCKKITDAHRGQIDFESRIKKGSRFWFCIPSEKPARK